MIKKRKHLDTILVISLALIICYLIFRSEYWLYALAVFLVFGWLSATFRNAVHLVWMGFARLLSKVTGSILLSLTFFLILTPISIFYRLFHPDPLRMKSKSRLKDSFFIPRNHKFEAKDMEKPW